MTQMKLHNLAGKPAPAETLANIPRLISAYYHRAPDAAIPAQLVSFGTSGHRGQALKGSFNEAHVLAITQAIVDYRETRGINGPLYLGIDTHGLSIPAFETALEVLAANGVEVMIDRDHGYTPTPVISHAILRHNHDRAAARADGIVITPSHNPPEDGGIKYNPPHGGPAESLVTGIIEHAANQYLGNQLREVKRVGYPRALTASTTHYHDYSKPYIDDLAAVVDMDAIKASGVHIGVDPLGGANVAIWDPLRERYGIRIDVVNTAVDPSFRFMPLDWDGRIRMDCSSPHAMAGLIALRDRFDIAFGNDADSDRHGIVTRSGGLMNPNHYLATAIDYLFRHRPAWSANVAVGKTLVSSSLIDRVASGLGRKLFEVPVGFKWFVPGLQTGALGFAGEESAGATFLRRDATAWTTDKDGIILGLLAAEMMAVTGRDPQSLYDTLTSELGAPCYERTDVTATPQQKAALAALSASDVSVMELAGEPIKAVLTKAPGDGNAIGGLKVTTQNAWFAARPSGTEDVYKIYAESFLGEDHLKRVQEQAQALVTAVLDR